MNAPQDKDGRKDILPLISGLLLLFSLVNAVAQPRPGPPATIPEIPQRLLPFIIQSTGFSAEIQWKQEEHSGRKDLEMAVYGRIATTKEVMRIDLVGLRKGGLFGHKRGDGETPFQLYDIRSNVVHTVLMAIDGYASSPFGQIHSDEAALVEAGRERINGTSAVKWMLPVETNSTGMATNFVWLSDTDKKHVVRWESRSHTQLTSIDFKNIRTEASTGDLPLVLPAGLKKYASVEHLFQEMLSRRSSQRPRLPSGGFPPGGPNGEKGPPP